MELLGRWHPDGLLSGSPVEDAMARILEEGPGVGTRAAFARADGWRAALKALRDDPVLLLRHRLVVFPQTQVRSYRADFMVVVGGRGGPPGTLGLSRDAFFVECDGKEFHGKADDVAADLERESVLRSETGMSVLRFSGPEILYRRHLVGLALSCQVEAFDAVQELGVDAVGPSADRVLAEVARLTGHFALRREYTARNTAEAIDPYDPVDSAGEWFDRREIFASPAAEWDPFLPLRTERAALRHAVALARRNAPDLIDEPEILVSRRAKSAA